MSKAQTIMDFLRLKRRLTTAYAMWGCKKVFVQRYCNNIDWRA